MTVRFERQSGIATITLDRQDKLNAISDEMWIKLYDYVTEIAGDDSVRTVILTGAGRAFSSGGDVGNMAKSDIVSSRARSKLRHRAITALYNLEKPVIAAVRGPVYGIATALALACDLVIASETAKFSMAFKKVGMIPDGGTIFFLSQYLGIGRAKELVYTARSFSAREAHEMGIVVKVVADEKLESEASAVAQEMMQSATYALAMAKKMFQSMAVPSLDMLLETECLAAAIVRSTHDHKEAVSAFKEKRPPSFLGR